MASRGLALALPFHVMNVLVTWGSERGGTEGIARIVADELEREGFAVVLLPANEVRDTSSFDAAIVGGALYAGRWHRVARRFVKRHDAELREMPTWLFSSGPLDDTADTGEIPPTPQVSALMNRVRARGHVTFGGRLTRDAKGFIASAMAKKRAGDWRNADRVREWAGEVGRALQALPARERPLMATPRSPLRGLLAALCIFVGLTAALGGAAFIARPDGSLVGMPLSVLDSSPFRDFLLPGLLLAILVGGTNALAGALVLAKHPKGDAEAIVSGALVSGWIVIQVLLIRSVHWLHVVYLALGIAIIAVAAVRAARGGTLTRTTGELALVASHVLVGWGICGVVMEALLARVGPSTAVAAHLLIVPVVFAGVASSYFKRRGAWSPLRAAAVFAGVTALLDLAVVATFLERSLAMFRSALGMWIPLGLIFLVTWMVGVVRHHRTHEPSHAA